MPVLAEILEGFSRLEGVHGALVLDPEGQVLAENLAEWPDRLGLASLVHRLGRAGDRVATSLGGPGLSHHFVEFADTQVIVEALDAGRMMVVVADSGANLGRIRLELRKNKKAVESSLASRESHVSQDSHSG